MKENKINRTNCCFQQGRGTRYSTDEQHVHHILMVRLSRKKNVKRKEENISSSLCAILLLSLNSFRATQLFLFACSLVARQSKNISQNIILPFQVKIATQKPQNHLFTEALLNDSTKKRIIANNKSKEKSNFQEENATLRTLRMFTTSLQKQ